jgi:succinate dehydrogenase / fumarate reductase, cytochrome b subunit
MSATAAGVPHSRNIRFYQSTAGKKAVMAVSGFILFTFVIGHLIGNLQIYEPPGPDGTYKIDQYAVFLRSLPAALWGARITLLVMVILHIWSSIQLAAKKLNARPIRYVKKKAIHSTYAARTMYWSGPIILAFIIYHLLDFTFGVANPNYFEGHVHDNIVASFSVPWISAFYVIAMVMLCLHLYHGLWSMFQTLGLHHPKYSAILRSSAKALAVLIWLGNISIPIAVLTGVVH